MIVLEYGDEAADCLLTFAKNESITAAQFSAIGAFSSATVGFFVFADHDYKKIEIQEQVEVLVLTGDISLFNGEIKVHAHVVLGKNDGSACGGHLLKGMVHPTLEVMLTQSPTHLVRKYDEASGLSLLKMDG